MDHTAVAGTILDRRNVLVLVELGRNHEATINVVARGGDREIGAGVYDEVGGAELPIVRELGGLWEVARITFRRAGLGPGDDGGDVFLG